MAFDCKGNRRGRCLVCNECEEFTPWGKNIRCAYCDCTPTKHQNFPGHELTAKDESAQTFSDSKLQKDESRLQNCSEESANQHIELTLESNGSVRGITSANLQNGSTGDVSLHRFTAIGHPVKEEDNSVKVAVPVRERKCPICRKGFKKTSNLKSHILLHKKKLQFKCQKCSRVFKNLDDLSMHKKSHQTEAKEQGSNGKLNGKVPPTPNHMLETPEKKKKSKANISMIAPKQSSVSTYQPGMNMWGSSSQNAYLMSPLTGGLFPQVTVPAQLLQTNPMNPAARAFHAVNQQNTPQEQIENQNNINPKMFSMLQGINAKANILSQIDRKLDYIIHSLSMPRQPMQEAPHFTVEPDQVTRSFEQISAQIEDPTQPSHLLVEPFPEGDSFKRGSLSPGHPIPDIVIEEAFRSSVSRRNLAKNLVFMLFTPEELRGRNCSGKVYGKGLPKERLDQRKLHAVKLATFKKYPCNPPEMDVIWQRECIKAIDKAIRSRALNNKL